MSNHQSPLSSLFVRAALPGTCIIALGLLTPAFAAPAQPGEAVANQAAQDQNRVEASVGILKTIEQEPDMASLLKDAKGIVVIPQYGSEHDGGAGKSVVVFRTKDGWSDPAFYAFSGISLGPHVKYGSLGSVVLIATNQHAMDALKKGQPFTIGGDSGLSVANYDQANGQPTAHKDFIMWTDVFRDFNQVPVHVAKVDWNSAENNAYYGQKVNAGQIIGGSATNSKGRKLTQVLPG